MLLKPLGHERQKSPDPEHSPEQKQRTVLILALLLFYIIFKNACIPLLLNPINDLNDALISVRASVKICVGKDLKSNIL